MLHVSVVRLMTACCISEGRQLWSDIRWYWSIGGRLTPQWIPKLAGISQLFSRHATAASLWVHLLAINMFAARWIMFDGAKLPLLLGMQISLQNQIVS